MARDVANEAARRADIRMGGETSALSGLILEESETERGEEGSSATDVEETGSGSSWERVEDVAIDAKDAVDDDATVGGVS